MVGSPRSVGACSTLILIAAASLLPYPSIAGADEFCATEKPEAVLACLEQAYDTRDIVAFENLLAPDYRFLATGTDSVSWDRDAEIAATKEFFESENVRDIDLTVSEGYELLPGPEPDTWVLDKVNAVVELTEGEEPKPSLTTLNFDSQRISVRRVSDPVVHYVIFELLRPAMPTGFERETEAETNE